VNGVLFYIIDFVDTVTTSTTATSNTSVAIGVDSVSAGGLCECTYF